MRTAGLRPRLLSFAIAESQVALALLLCSLNSSAATRRAPDGGKGPVADAREVAGVGRELRGRVLHREVLRFPDRGGEVGRRGALVDDDALGGYAAKADFLVHSPQQVRVLLDVDG